MKEYEKGKENKGGAKNKKRKNKKSKNKAYLIDKEYQNFWRQIVLARGKSTQKRRDFGYKKCTLTQEELQKFEVYSLL